MSRRMYDSVNLDAIPSDAQMVAYYIDGAYRANELEVRKRWPNAVLVPISAVATNAGIVGDVEAGDLTPAGSVDWVLMRRAAGVQPSLYFSIAQWITVRSEFGQRGVPEPPYWVAHYDGVVVIPPGAVAKQYADAAMVGGDYDLSIVADFWPGIDRGPVVSLEPLEGSMQFFTVPLKDFRGNPQQHMAGVNSQGTLRHAYYIGEPDKPGWGENDTGVTGLAPYAPVDVYVSATQIHILTGHPNGAFVHAYQQIGTPQWMVEYI